MSLTTVSSFAVTRAVYDLHERTGEWPTPHGIASYLETTAEDVRPHLLALRAQRLFRMRQRQGKRVWMPWAQS